MNISKKFDIIRMTFSIIIALLISFILIFMVSKEPITAITKLVTGPFSSPRNFANVIESMIPLIFTGTGICIMFSANQINLAAEGAFHIGGIVASIITIKFILPFGLSPVLALLLSATAGAIFTSIPAIMKIKTSASELVSSLMLNYIALWTATLLMKTFILDPENSSYSMKIPEAAKLLVMFSGTRIHIGLILALIVSFLAYILLFKTKIGYEIRVTGENEKFAKYSGINILKVVLISQLIGGFIAGLGGGVEMLSPIYNRFSWTALLGYGWDAIIICTLARKNPLFVPLSAFFLAYLRVGASVMARYSDVTLEIVQITQGIIIVLVVAEQFLSKYKDKLIKKEAQLGLKEENV